MSKKRYFILFSGALIIAFITVLASSQNIFAVWTEPIGLPPTGNISAPLNVSGVPQTKLGSLDIRGNLISGGSFTGENNIISKSNILLQDTNTSGIYWANTNDSALPHIDFEQVSPVTEENRNKLFISAGDAYSEIKLQGKVVIENAGVNGSSLCFGSDCMTNIIWGKNEEGNIYPTNAGEEKFKIDTNGNIVYQNIPFGEPRGIFFSNPAMMAETHINLESNKVYLSGGEISGAFTEVQGKLKIGDAGDNSAKICFDDTDCVTGWSNTNIGWWKRDTAAAPSFIYPGNITTGDGKSFKINEKGVLVVTNPSSTLSGDAIETNSAIVGTGGILTGAGKSYGLVGIAGGSNLGAVSLIGVLGKTEQDNANSYGIYGEATKANAYAGYFKGKTTVEGDFKVKTGIITEEHGAVSYNSCVVVRAVPIGQNCTNACTPTTHPCMAGKTIGAVGWTECSNSVAARDCLCC